MKTAVGPSEPVGAAGEGAAGDGGARADEGAPVSDASAAAVLGGGGLPAGLRWDLVAKAAIVLALAAALVLRFWTPSALWLDEALTVDIARAPLHEIPVLLRDDGAPPL